MVECPRCGNTDPNSFINVNGKSVCRACLKYQGRIADIKDRINYHKVTATLSYSLSKEQIELSDKLLNSNTDTYVSAVCGAGKTEITFKSIEQALRKGYRVGFIIPRKEVVIEIAQRLREVYKNVVITEVYGGHTQVLDGEIVVLTTHQAYRYQNKFGLIIVDEYDAFPFKGDLVLHNFVARSCFGKRIYLSATFSSSFLKGKNSLELNKRYHNKPLIVPLFKKVKASNMLICIIIEIKRLLKKEGTIFLYMPYIDDAIKYYNILRFIFRPCGLFHSKIANKTNLFNDIKQGKYRLIVCTTILERGITIKDLDCIVAYADNPIFDTPTLIQIAGRVGRKINRTHGTVLLLAQKETDEIKNAIKQIERTNAKVFTM